MPVTRAVWGKVGRGLISDQCATRGDAGRGGAGYARAEGRGSARRLEAGRGPLMPENRLEPPESVSLESQQASARASARKATIAGWGLLGGTSLMAALFQQNALAGNCQSLRAKKIRMASTAAFSASPATSGTADGLQL